MTRFWAFFIEKRSFTILLIAALVAAGAYAVSAIPKESSPEVQIPLGIVVTALPGASAADTERLVTDKIEDAVIGVEGVSKVTSTSGAGVSNVSVEFVASADIDKSIQLLKDAVDKAKSDLPTEAEDPYVTDVNFADQPILIASVSGDLTPEELTADGKVIETELDRVAGVSRVDLAGVRARQVSVIVKQAKLAQYGLTLSDVTNAIRASGAAAPLGAITVDGVSYAVRFEAGLSTPEEVAQVAVRGPGGTALTIGSVADVVDGLADTSTYSRVSVAGKPSQPALTLSVYKSRGGNIVDVGARTKSALSSLASTTLSGATVVITYDAAHDVKKDLTELTKTGLETVGLVLIVLFATLGWRESLVAAASIPLSFLFAFIGLAASGNTINFISLFSLILAIGILVDTGIVVVEAIHTHLAHGKTRRAAAIAAIEEYAWPLIAGTMTTVAVFIPLFFLSGIVGKFIASIPFTVIFVLVASIFVALGLVPLIAVSFVRPNLSALEKRQEAYNERAKEWYRGFLGRLLARRDWQNRFIWILIGLFVLTLALPAVGIVHSVFFPQDDSDLAYLDIEKPQGTDLSETDLSAREVEEVLYHDPRIESFVTTVGAGNVFSGSGASGGNIANISMNLDPDRKESSEEVIASLRKQLAAVTSATVTVSEPASGPPSGAALSITFIGDDLASLATAADRGAQVLASTPGATNVSASTKEAGAEFILTLDQSKAAALGVSPSVVADALRTSLYGAKAASIRTSADDIEVHTKLDLNPDYADPSETADATIDAVYALLVPGTKGPVPLSSVATVAYEPAESAIRHEDGDRIQTVSGDLAPGASAPAVTAAFQKKMQSVQLPDGVTMKVGGETEDVNQSFTEMLLALVAGAGLMLAILVLEFNSFRHSLHLLSIIPLSLVGVLAGLAVTGAPLSFPSLLGVIALSGVIINHAIILMDSIHRIGDAHPEYTLEKTVIEAASTRLRPIVLTTVTTVVGMIPLSFASALWGPLAFAIMFGLAFSLVLTLVLIPVLYYRSPNAQRAD